MEERPIAGFPGYAVTDEGQVISYKSGKRYVKRLITNSATRYSVVTLSRRISSVPQSVHRLVAMAFIPNPETKTQINHKNGLRTDNRAENLEWCTPSENLKHSYRVLKREKPLLNRGKFGASHPTARPVTQRTLTGDFIANYGSVTEAAQAGFNLSQISKCCLRKRKTHKGFRWEFTTKGEL